MKSKLQAILDQVKDQRIELRKEKVILAAARGTKPLVSYLGWIGHNNLGDEILYEAHRVLFPRLQFVPYRPHAAASVIRKLQRRPLYVAGFLGGGTLINQSPAWIRKIQYLRRQGLPMYCFGTGVTEDSFRMAFEKTSIAQWVPVVEKFTFAGIRGPRSLKLLTEAGASNVHQIGDTALALAPAKVKKRAPNKVIGFNYGLVKENQIWGDTDVYTDKVVQAIQELIAEGYEVRLLPVWSKDIESNKALLARVNDPKCTMRLRFGSLVEYTKELDECGLFIGQKLHATIMACMQHIPSIMIEYQPKCRDFMASVDMEQYILKTSECTPQALVGMIHDIERDYTAISTKLGERVTHYRDLQYKLAREIEDKLLARSSSPHA